MNSLKLEAPTPQGQGKEFYSKAKSSFMLPCGEVRCVHYLRGGSGQAEELDWMVLPGLGESYLAFRHFLHNLAPLPGNLAFFALESIKLPSIKWEECRNRWRRGKGIREKQKALSGYLNETLLQALDQGGNLYKADPLTLEAEVFLKLLQAQGIRRIKCLVGHSTGALRAVRLLERLAQLPNPITIDQLVLVHPGGFNPGMTGWGLAWNYFVRHGLQRRKISLDDEARQREHLSLKETRKILFKGLPSFLLTLKLTKALARTRIAPKLVALLEAGRLQGATILHSDADRVFGEGFTPPAHPQVEVVFTEGGPHGLWLICNHTQGEYWGSLGATP